MESNTVRFDTISIYSGVNRTTDKLSNTVAAKIATATIYVEIAFFATVSLDATRGLQEMDTTGPHTHI